MCSTYTKHSLHTTVCKLTSDSPQACSFNDDKLWSEEEGEGLESMRYRKQITMRT